LEKASAGILLIDEVSEIPLETQSKILRIIIDQKFKRINGTHDINVDVRIICSASKDIKNEIKIGNFREDLFHRLNVFNINIDPLNKRSEDIPLLVDYFLENICKNYNIKDVKIPLLGIHNIRNATVAAAVATTIGISSIVTKQALKEFKGVQRRFNKIFTFKKAIFFDDYAHHPTEIKELLNGVKKVYNNKEVVCVFQPHRISRLRNLKKEFSLSFKKANKVILCPVYAAGEKLKLGFNYHNFAKAIAKNSRVNVFLIKNEFQLAKYVKQNVYGEKIVIGIGAGSISSWIRNLPNLI